MPRKRKRSSLLCFTVLVAFPFLPHPACAQQQPDPSQEQTRPSQPPSSDQPVPAAQTHQDPKKDEAPGPQTATSNDRLFWALPNFLSVENAKNIRPLSTKEKFKVTARSSFDPVEYPYVGFLAGISQAQNSEPGFGQGAAGYAKRYGAAFADNTIENFMTAAVLPSLLRQDPRYYPLGRGSFWHRTGYSISRTFITRSDSGHAQFNISEIGGSAVAGGISTTYHPADDRTFANAMSVWWTQVGWDTLAIVVREFWPDIRRKLRKPKE